LHPNIRPALIVGLGLAVFQQITGVNTVIYYAPIIFQLAGVLSPSSAILATAAVGVVNVLFTVIAMLLLDRVGRRPLLLNGLAGMVIGLAALGLAFALPLSPTERGWMAAGSLTLYIAAFAVGLGPVFWLLISEIYPLRARGLAMSLATMVNWGFNLLVTLTFLSLIAALGRAGAFWCYALLSICAWFFAYFLVPETKGRTLEEIEAHWQAGKHARELGQSAAGAG
jgi:sugar porter (SP) family MFS transporter